MRTANVSRLKTLQVQGTAATHCLKKQGQVLLAGLKHEGHGSYSQTIEPKMGIISKLET
jgi:hypothetical protein